MDLLLCFSLLRPSSRDSKVTLSNKFGSHDDTFYITGSTYPTNTDMGGGIDKVIVRCQHQNSPDPWNGFNKDAPIKACE